MSKELFKTFSFSTTIRNPQRNIDFLKALAKFNGYELNENLAQNYFLELIKNGIYILKNTPQNIYEKLQNDINLNKNDIQTLFTLNPHIANIEKIYFRFKTHVEALFYQALLIIDNNRIFISKFGFDLIENNIPSTDIYTKLMIGLHYHNPTKSFTNNKSRVFLNTIFVIDLLKKECFESKGVLKHEFQVFILGMKDCDYKKCVKEILAYRKKFKYSENKEYLQDYLFKNESFKKVKYDTLNDYCDEVFRKFEMTGLLIKRGAFKNIYYDFSNFNLKRIESILDNFKDYRFYNFTNIYQYFDFLDSITLPYLDSKIKKEAILQKAKVLNLDSKNLDFSNLESLESNLNARFYNKIIDSKLQNCEIDILINELENLALNKESQHKEYKILSEPLRLEYLLALILGKKYGTRELISNLIYNENGEPLSFAPGGKSDIEFKDFLIEATMIKNKNQQLNSETTSIARHMKESEDKLKKPLRTLLIAPYIHFDVALFFKFVAIEFESKIAPISIINFIKLIKDSPNFDDFQKNFDNFVASLLAYKTKDYIDVINKI